MTLKKFTLTAAMCLTAIGWSAAQAQDQNYPNYQQPNRSGQTRSGDAQYQRGTRQGDGQWQDRQGQGSNQGTYQDRGRYRDQAQGRGNYRNDGDYQGSQGGSYQDRGGYGSDRRESYSQRYNRDGGQWRSAGRGRSGYSHSRRCRVQWRHHRRMRVCR